MREYVSRLYLLLFQAKADEILGKVMVQVEEIKSKETLFIQFKHTLVSILQGFEPLTAMYNFLLSSSAIHNMHFVE